MDCLSSSSSIQRVVFMKGAQIGGTECGNNWIGYVIHHTPGPMLAILPTVEMAMRLIIPISVMGFINLMSVRRNQRRKAFGKGLLQSLINGESKINANIGFSRVLQP